MYHIFFIHLSIDGHLGCFHVLSIVNSASMNIGMQVSFQIGFLSFLNIHQGVGLLDHMVTLFYFFKEPILFCIVAAPIFIPTNSVGDPFLHTLSNI